MVRCLHQKADGPCKAIAIKGSDFCRHHQPPKPELIHFGYSDQEWQEQMAAAYRRNQLANFPRPKPVPEQKKTYSCRENDPEFWAGYSYAEIQNYVANDTGGRVVFPMHLTIEQLVAQACEVYA